MRTLLFSLSLVVIALSTVTGSQLPTNGCHTVRCAWPECPIGGFVYTPPNRCCPVCIVLSNVPTCPYTLCVRPDCTLSNGELYTPLGKCCPRCRQCAAVSCIRPQCGADEELYTPAGQCCPRCRVVSGTAPPSCAYTTCPANPTCPSGQELYRPPDECCYACRSIY